MKRAWSPLYLPALSGRPLDTTAMRKEGSVWIVQTAEALFGNAAGAGTLGISSPCTHRNKPAPRHLRTWNRVSFPFWKESKNTSSTEGLKRSNTAARQALHEVSKHVEQVKQYCGTSASLSSLSPPIYEYMAYAAVQMLPDETCLQIISCDEALFEEAQDAILLMPTEERARYLHECVASVPPFPECDYREIG